MERIKHAYGNVRRHWKLFGLLAIMGFLCWKMFWSNYVVILPIVKKDAYEDPIQLHNDIAICNQALDEAQAAVHAQNVAATADFNQ